MLEPLPPVWEIGFGLKEKIEDQFLCLFLKYINTPLKKKDEQKSICFGIIYHGGKKIVTKQMSNVIGN